MFADMTIKGFLEKVSSDSPFPGGGSVAALASSLAAGLCEMVARLTAGRKKFEAVHEEMTEIIRESAELRCRLMANIDRDSQAYQSVMDAYRLPKLTPDEKQTRSDAIEKAMKYAAAVPMEAAEDVIRVMELSERVIRKGNQNAATDGRVGVLMARSAALAGLYNVQINLASIKDTDFVKNMQDRAEILRERAINTEKEIIG